MIGEYQKSRKKIVCFALILALMITMVPFVSLGGDDNLEETNITGLVDFGNLEIWLSGTKIWENGTMTGAEGLSIKKGDNVTLKGTWEISESVLATVSPGAYFLVELPSYFDFRSTIDGQDLKASVGGKEVKIGEFSLVENGDNYALKVMITNLYYENSKGQTVRVSSLDDGTFTATAYAKTVTTEEPYYFHYGENTDWIGPPITDGHDWGTNTEKENKLSKVGNVDGNKGKWTVSVNMEDYISFLSSADSDIKAKEELLIEDTLPANDNRMLFDTSQNIKATLPYYVINADGEVTNTILQTYNITNQFTKVTPKAGSDYNAFVQEVKAAGENGAAYGFYDNKHFVMYIGSLPGSGFVSQLPLEGDNNLKGKMEEYLDNNTDSQWKYFSQSVYDKTLAAYERFYDTSGNDAQIIGFNFTLETTITGAERDVQNSIEMTWKGGSRKVTSEKEHFQSIDVTVKIPEKGQILITKLDTDKSGIPLSGAAFKLMKLDETTGQFVDYEYGEIDYTNSEGMVTFEPLDPGRYKIIEVSTIEGYDPKLNVKKVITVSGKETYEDLLGADKNEFDISADDKTGFVFEAYNAQKKGSAKVIKLDEDDNTVAVAGAKLYLKDEYDNKVLSGGSIYYAITNNNGEAVWTGLSWGKYTVYEESAAYGYEKALKFIDDNDDDPTNNGTFRIDQSNVDVQKVIKATNKKGKGQLVLEKTDGDTGKVISGASFRLEVYNGDAFVPATSPGAQAGTEWILTTDDEGLITFTDLEWGTYRIVEVSQAPGYESGKAVYTGGLGDDNNEFTIGSDKNKDETIKAYIKCENTPLHGSAKLYKKDSSDNSNISGSAFYLKKDGETYMTMQNGTLTTYYAISGADGVAEFENLPWGDYEVFEGKAAYGYDNELILDAGAKKTFTIDADNVSATIELGTFLNNPGKGSFSMKKLSSGGGISDNPGIAGAKFLLTNKDDGTTYEAISDSNGRVEVNNLPWGTYTVSETSAADGYEGDFYIPGATKPYTFTIDDQNNNMEHHWTAYNTRQLGNMDLYKFDKDTNKGIAGAKFKLVLNDGSFYKDASGNVVEAETNAEGIASFTDLPWGTYTVTESAVAIGYNASSFEMSNPTFTIGADNAGTTVTYSALNTKTKGSVEITKKDSTNKNLLNNTEFYLVDENGDTVKKNEVTVSAITGKTQTGVATFTDLDWGTYTVKELKAPKGYLNNPVFVDENGNPISNGGTFTINESNAHEKVQFTVEDDRSPGNVKVIKTDSKTGDEISGASFYLKLDKEVYKTTQNGIYTTEYAIAGADGVAEFTDLPWGDYELAEYETAEGYILDSFTVEGGKTFTIDAENAETVITLNAENSSQDGVLKIKKLDGDATTTDNALEGAVFYLEKDGEDFNEPGTNKRYEVETDAVGEATFIDLPWGDYEVKELNPPRGYESGSLKFVDEKGQEVTDGAKFSLTKSNASETVYLTAENTRITGDVELLKEDVDDNTPLSGAEFYLVKEDGSTYMEDGTTTTKAIEDSNGIYKFTDLPWGTYTVKELKAAEGYKLNSFTMANDGKFTVGKNTVTDSNNEKTVIKLTATNEKYNGGVSIYKKDSTDEKNINGAVFYLEKDGEIYMAGGQTMITAAAVDGIATFKDLPWGTYTVKELKAAPGYEGKLIFVDENGYAVDNGGTFTIDQNTVRDDIRVYAENDRIDGKVIIHKKDATDNDLNISGAVFYLEKDGKTYMSDGETTTEAISDKNGVAEFTNLPWGEYTVKELKAATGYEKTLTFVDKDGNTVENGGTFTLDDSNVEEELILNATNERVLGKVEIYKTDAADERNISGAVFYLEKDGKTYMADGKTTTEAISDNNGLAVFTDLPWGSYEVKELSPAEGYEPDTLKFTGTNKGKFTLSDQNVEDTVTVTATNERTNGKIQILKADSLDNGVIEGVSFYLLKNGTVYKDDEGVTITAITDKNGIAKFENLPWDTYKIIELEAASGYDKDSLEIESDGVCIINDKSVEQTITFEATNDRILGDVQIEKLDSANTGTALKGAEFYLENGDGETYMTTQDGIFTTAVAITDDNGVARFSDLPWGTYTVKELTAPQGYESGSLKFTDDSEGQFTINQEKQTDIKLTATNDRVIGSFMLEKMDSIDNDIKLAGAEFYLEKLNEDTNKFEEVKINGNRLLGITDIYGVAKFIELEWGTYRIIESKAPEGYDKDSLIFDGESNEFVIGAAEQHVYYGAYNTLEDVKGETGIPVNTSSGNDDTPGSVLGEEAKTGDYLDWALLVGAILMAMLILTLASIRLNKRQTNEM